MKDEKKVKKESEEKVIDDKEVVVDKKEKEEITEAEVDVTKIISDLGKTNWGSDNDAQGKAVQLLRGLAFSDDTKSNEFMKALSDASTAIAKKVLGVNENTLLDMASRHLI